MVVSPCCHHPCHLEGPGHGEMSWLCLTAGMLEQLPRPVPSAGYCHGAQWALNSFMPLQCPAERACCAALLLPNAKPEWPERCRAGVLVCAVRTSWKGGMMPVLGCVRLQPPPRSHHGVPSRSSRTGPCQGRPFPSVPSRTRRISQRAISPWFSRRRHTALPVAARGGGRQHPWPDPPCFK